MPNLSEPTPPSVAWAQTNHLIFLTICLEDCKDPLISLENDKLSFDGVGGTDKKQHKVTINFNKEIDAEKSQTFVRERNIELIIKKKEDDIGFWPRLTKEKNKFHWLKIDFNKWKDETESDEERMGDDWNMLKEMGGLGGRDTSKPNFDDLLDVDNNSDSDDEGLPGLE